MDELVGSIQLNGESVFFHSLSQNKEKLELYKKALLEGKITVFDQTILTRLRKLYYGYYSGIIFLYYKPTDFHNIGSKVELLTHAMEGKEYQIVHGDTDSTRNIPFFMYGVNHLDFNSWIEVKEGRKVWVYDLFSMLRIEKDVYYKLENPKVNQVISKAEIVNHPARLDDHFDTYHDGFNFSLVKEIPDMERNMDKHPFKEILSPELARFKKEIHYEDLQLEYEEWKKKSY